MDRDDEGTGTADDARARSDAFNIDSDAARSAARDHAAPAPTRKPASDDVDNARVAEAKVESEREE